MTYTLGIDLHKSTSAWVLIDGEYKEIWQKTSVLSHSDHISSAISSLPVLPSNIKVASVRKEGNCYVEGSDFAAVDRLAQRLTRSAVISRLREVCERWLYSSCLCFGLTREEQRRSGFAYQYSVFQLELSRNLLFARGGTMNEVYQKLIDRTRAPLDLEQLKTIFGSRHRPHRQVTRGRTGPEVVKALSAPSYDLTVFKVQWGQLTLKIYDKGERVLRIEVVVHNAKALRCGKILDKLPLLLERMTGMLVRFLNTVRAAHVSFLDQGACEPCVPTWSCASRSSNPCWLASRDRWVDLPNIPIRWMNTISS